MNTQKIMSALVLAFSVAAASAGCATKNVAQLAPDRAMNRMDFDCKTVPITYVNEAENCLAAVLTAEEAFDQKLVKSLGDPNSPEVDYDKMGALYRAAESQYCTEASTAREIWVNVLAGSRSGGGYVRNNRDLYGSMVRYFEMSARCYDDYQQVFMEIKDPTLEAEAERRSNQAQSIASALANRYRR